MHVYALSACSSVSGCDCVYPYTGDTCADIDYCQDNYCVHGTCATVNDGTSALSMLSQEGCLTEDSSKKILRTAPGSFARVTHVIIIHVFTEAVCTCDDGYLTDAATGQCTTIYLCADGVTSCMHDASCNADGNGCDCDGEWTGTSCETRKHQHL